MQRLLKEYLGQFNPIFQKEAQCTADKFDTDTYVINGVVRWKSNNQVPPDDILELWHYLNKPFDYELSLLTSHDETTIALAEYRRQMTNHVYSAEERAEMQAAFGPGAKVVDVITGQTIQF